MRGPTPECGVEHSARRHSVNQRAAAKEPESKLRLWPRLRPAPACEVQPGSTSVSALRMPSHSASRTFCGEASCATRGRVGCFCYLRCSLPRGPSRGKVVVVRLGSLPCPRLCPPLPTRGGRASPADAGSGVGFAASARGFG